MSYRNSNRYPSNGGRNDGNQQNWRSSNNQRDSNDDDGWGSARPNYQQRQPRNSNQNSNEGSGDNDGWGSAPNDGWGSAPARKPAQPRRQPDENDVNSSIQVPSNKVGKIIGRGGSKIRELQSETNTEVQIDKNATDAEYNMSKINLIGSDEDVQRVKKLIEDLVAEDNYSQSNGGGGRKYYNLKFAKYTQRS